MSVTALPSTAAAQSTARSAQGVVDQGDQVALGKALDALATRRWDDARQIIDAMARSPLRAYARAELYLAAGSPAVSAQDLALLVGEAPDLPQASRLAALARQRGALDASPTPTTNRLVWTDAITAREALAPRTSDATRAIFDRIKNDDAPGAEAAWIAAQPNLSPEQQAEWGQRVAWTHFVHNDDASARRVADTVTVAPWTARAQWVASLAAWRQRDCSAARDGFDRVSESAQSNELRAAALFWGARAHTSCGSNRAVTDRLTKAARFDETFYGILAAESLGKTPRADAKPQAVRNHANVVLARALVALGQDSRAAEVLRHQARIGDPSEHSALAELAGALNLPETQLFLAHNVPQGHSLSWRARYPAPVWQPASGWRVEPALILAHTLRESRFQRTAVSPAGAVGLMQVRPGTARDMSQSRAFGIDPTRLKTPEVNMALGQAYLEHLRDNPATGGLLPKVIAAYNAGLTPLTRWNTDIQSGDDPLLFIESIPYWETRGYVAEVLRNYWMYERQAGRPLNTARDLIVGRWPRFPSMGTVTAQGGGSSATVANAQ